MSNKEKKSYRKDLIERINSHNQKYNFHGSVSRTLSSVKQIILDSVYNEWSKFYSGKWTKDMPTKPGVYVIATRQGEWAGTTHVTISHEGNPFTPSFLTEEYSGTKWKGWFWSEAIPENFSLPDPPCEK